MSPGDLFIKARSHNYSAPDRKLYIFIEDHHEEVDWGWFLGPGGLRLHHKPDFDPVEEDEHFSPTEV